MLRRCLKVALASVFLMPALLPLRVEATTNEVPPPAAAEEISVASLGLMAQVVHGPSPSLNVRFPPPVRSLTASGSYVRIFFGHSPLVSAGSNLQVLVNGQLLDTVGLTPGTSAGAVFVLQVPVAALHLDQANLVEFAFSLVAAVPAAASDLYGRVDADTALHYQLGAIAGTIEAYPYSLLGGSLAGSLADVPLGLVIPSAPDDQELAAAFRLTADASRRLRGARLRINLVSKGQEPWLQEGGSPAVLVGRVADLPGSARLLNAAGFTSSAGGWTNRGAPAPITADEGIIAAVVSPWDGHSPLLLVTGDSDNGVARAAAAVLDSRHLRLSGHAAVVPQLASAGPTDTPDVPLRTLLPEQLTIHGPGDHVIAFGVPVPGIAGSFPATVSLKLVTTRSTASGVTSPELTVEVGGHTVRTASHVAALGQVETAELDIRGALRHGMNGVTLDLRLADGVGEARLATELSNMRPLPTPSASATLDQLPDPFLDARGTTGPTVALSDLQPTTLAGAVAAMAALGSRAVVAPAPLSVVILGKDHQLPSSAGSVLVIGGPVGQALRLHSGAFRTEVISPPTTVTDGRSGWIAELGLPAAVSALWVGGDPKTLAVTGMALANPDLSGQIAVVPPDGVPHNLLGVNPGSATEPLPIGAAARLPMAAGVLLLGLLALELGRQWRLSP